MASYGFHSEAADEYLEATRYYLDHSIYAVMHFSRRPDYWHHRRS